MVKPTIPQSLQPPVRTLTLGQQKAPAREAARLENLRTEYEQFVEKIPQLSFEEYKTKYQNLPADIKQYFENPAKLQADLDAANAPAIQAQKDYATGWKIGTGEGAKEGLGNAPQGNASAALKQGFQDARKKRRYAVESYNLQVQEFKDYVQTYRDQGFDPIIKTTSEGSKIVGFRDNINQQTIPLPNQTLAAPQDLDFSPSPNQTFASREDFALQSFASPSDFPKTPQQKLKAFAKDYYDKGIRKPVSTIYGAGKQIYQDTLQEPISVVAGVPKRTGNFLYDSAGSGTRTFYQDALKEPVLTIYGEGKQIYEDTLKEPVSTIFGGMKQIYQDTLQEPIREVSKAPDRIGAFLYRDIDSNVKMMAADIGRFSTKPIDFFQKDPMSSVARNEKARLISGGAERILFLPRDEPVKTAGIFLGGYLFGAGSTALASTGSIGAVASELGGGLLGLGYAASTVQGYQQTAPGSKERGSFIAGTAVELGVFSAGSKLGGDLITGRPKRTALERSRESLEKERIALEKLGKEADKLSIGGEPFVRRLQGTATDAKGREINLFSQEQGKFKTILQARRDTEINLLSGFEEAPLIRGGKAPEFGSNIISKNVEIGLDKTLFPQVKDIPIKTIRGKDRNVFAGFNRAGEFSATTYGTYRGSSRGDEFLGVGTLWARGSRDRPINKRDIIIKQKGDAPAEVSLYAKGKKSRIVRDNLIVDKIPEKRSTDTFLIENKLIETREDAGANTITSIYSSKIKRADVKPQSLSLGVYGAEIARKPRTKQELDPYFKSAKTQGEMIGAEVKTITATRDINEGRVLEFTKEGYSIGGSRGDKLQPLITPEGRTKPPSKKTAEKNTGRESEFAPLEFAPPKKPRKIIIPTPQKFVKDTPLYVGGKGGSSSRGAYAFEGGKSVFGSPKGSMQFSNVPNTSLGFGANRFTAGVGLVGGLGLKSLVATGQDLKSPLDTQLQNKTKLDTENVLVTRLDTAQAPALSFNQTQQQQQQQSQSQQQSQRTSQGLSTTLILRTPTGTPTTTTKKTVEPKFEFFFPFLPPKQPGFRTEKSAGYNVMVKERGKFKKINTKPYTRAGAMDLGARTVDNTVNATWKIAPVKKTVTKKGKEKKVNKLFKPGKLATGDNYFNRTKVKYRPYQVKKGKKVALQNKWIEKQGKRADTSGEQKGLTIAKFKAQGRRNLFRL